MLSPGRYYEPGLLLMCFLLPTLVPWYCWGEIFLHSFYVAALLSYALVLSAIWLAKSAAHLCGHRPHNTGAQETVTTSVGAQGKSAVYSVSTSIGLLVRILCPLKDQRFVCFSRQSFSV